MGNIPIILNEIEINEYRNLMRTVKLWDSSYAPIKNDINSIKSKLIFMDAAYDYAGTFTEKALLAMRLLTYGESGGDLNIYDIATLLTPVSDTNHLTSNTSDVDDVVEFTTKAIPMCFTLIKSETASSEKELREAIRAIVCAAAGITKLLIGISIALDFCLHSYGMDDWRDLMINQIENIIAETDSCPAKKVLEDARKVFGRAFKLSTNKFGGLMSILLLECNQGEIDYRQVSELILDMRSEIVRRGHKHDFLDFLDSGGFREFVKHTQKYHNLNEEEHKHEKDQSIH